jgi:hypothetical protein
LTKRVIGPLVRLVVQMVISRGFALDPAERDERTLARLSYDLHEAELAIERFA